MNTQYKKLWDTDARSSETELKIRNDRDLGG